MKKGFYKKWWFWIMLISIILALFFMSIFIFRYIKFEKDFVFYDCKGSITNYLFNPQSYCGDIESFVNYKEHVKVVKCLCEKYESPELDQILDEYTNRYFYIINEKGWLVYGNILLSGSAEVSDICSLQQELYAGCM